MEIAPNQSFEFVYDFVKVVEYSEDVARNLLDNPMLNFKGIYDRRTGEAIESHFTAMHRFLTINVINTSRIEITGSLHQYWNDSICNYDQFSLKNVTSAINELRDSLGINPHKARLHNLEFGANLITPFNPDLVINNLIAFGDRALNKMDMFGKGNGRKVKFRQYSFKCYNKTLQHDLTDNIFRIESHINKMENLRDEYLFLGDLSSIDVFNYNFDRLIDDYEQLIITETVSKLSRANNKLYVRCNNPREWELMEPKERFDNKRRFNTLIKKYGNQRIKTNLDHLINATRKQLIST